jgi:hypothetical protein
MCSPLNVSDFRVVLFSADFSCLKFMRFVTAFYQLCLQHATFLPVTVFLTANQETQSWNVENENGCWRSRLYRDSHTYSSAVWRYLYLFSATEAPHTKHGNSPETNSITVNINRSQVYVEVTGPNSSGGFSVNDLWEKSSLGIIYHTVRFGAKLRFGLHVPPSQSPIHKATSALGLLQYKEQTASNGYLFPGYCPKTFHVLH